MVRGPEVLVPQDAAPGEESGDPGLVSSSSQVLPAMFVASLGLLLLRAVFMAYGVLARDVEDGEPSGKNIARGIPFFLGALANVLLRLGSATGHGLLAINWMLAGAEPGMQLVACFVLVTVNTHMLASVALVVHLRSLLAAVAIAQQSCVSFKGISHLWGAPAGIACLALNGISTGILLAYLYQFRPERIVTWLATAGGFLMWANSSFRSVGLMDGQTWKEISEAEAHVGAMSVSDFMRSLDINVEDDVGNGAFWWQVLCFRFKQDDELLLRHRQALLRRAYPQSPTLRRAHGATVLLLGLMTTAVPALLVAHCLARVPLLRDVELVGGAYFPSLSNARQDYYIAIEDSGSNGISMIFQMELGEASRHRFCCGDAGCSGIETNEQSSQVRLKLMISPKQFGTCQLQLIGLQSNTYNFTVLSLRHLDPVLNAEAEAPFAPYRAKQHLYDCDLVKPDDAEELVLTSTLRMDTRRIRPKLQAFGLSNATTFPLTPLVSNDLVTVKANLSQMQAALNVTLRITLLPEDESAEMPPQITSNQYQVSVRVFTIEERLKALLSEISELQGRIDANQETSSQAELTQNLAKLEKATDSRNQLLRRAYWNHPPDSLVLDSERVTFLTIGVTGTGKSELCRWMTGKLEECQSSDSMESHTSDVHRVQAHAFSDNRLQPKIEWIDTPGRGDTRGASHDSQLWKQTMQSLRARAKRGFRIDRIIWVVNAAWQRATELRNRMLQELRMSFGVDLYQNLVIMLNFLPHTANSTEYEEVKQRQKEKFVNWIMKREDEMFHWPDSLRQGVEEEVMNLQVYGADINPKFLKEKPGDVPISGPYLHSFPPYSHPAGVAELMALVKDTWERKRRGTPGLLLDNEHPRIGPGKLENVSVDLNCSWKAPEDEAKKELLVQADAEIQARGKSFSPWDKALVVPKDLNCGVRDPDEWGSFDWSNRGLEVLSLGAENTSSTFQSSDWDEGEQKLCFCEAPSCNETWRFGQEQALPSLQCPAFYQKVKLKEQGIQGQDPKDDHEDPFLKIIDKPGKDRKDADVAPFFLASVQGRTFGLPLNGQSSDAIYEFHLEEGGLRTSRHPIEEAYRKPWRSSSAFGTGLFALDTSGQYILSVDVNQDPLGISLLQPLSPDDSLVDLPYNAILATEDHLYLVPGRVANVGVFNLKDRTLKKIDLDINSGCPKPKKKNGWNPRPQKLWNPMGLSQLKADRWNDDGWGNSDWPQEEEEAPMPERAPPPKADPKSGAERRPLPEGKGTHLEGEMKTQEEFEEIFGSYSTGQKKWTEAENLEERRYNSDKTKMYTKQEFERAFGRKTLNWKLQWKLAPVAPPLRKAVPSCNRFAAPCLADGKLFAPPWESSQYLVLSGDAPEVFDVSSSRFGWAAFAESNGIVYGCPYMGKQVLAIDAKDPQNHVLLDDVPGGPYTGLTALEGRIFLAPGSSGAPTLLDPSTSFFWTLPEDEDGSSPDRAQHQRGSAQQMATKRGPRMQMATRKKSTKKGKSTGKSRKSKGKSFRSSGPRDRRDEVDGLEDGGIEKFRRSIVSLGNRLVLSPGSKDYMLMVNLFSGISVKGNAWSSVREQLNGGGWR